MTTTYPLVNVGEANEWATEQWELMVHNNEPALTRMRELAMVAVWQFASGRNRGHNGEKELLADMLHEYHENFSTRHDIPPLGDEDTVTFSLGLRLIDWTEIAGNLLEQVNTWMREEYEECTQTEVDEGELAIEFLSQEYDTMIGTFRSERNL